MDLELVATDELIAELFRRHPAVVLAVEKDSMDEDGCTELFERYKGCTSQCLGMVVRLRRKILRDLTRAEAES